MTLTYPAWFMLIAAMNPCPCSNLTDPRQSCICSPQLVHRYQSRISGPPLDRIDIHIQVPGNTYAELSSGRSTTTSKSIRARINSCRQRQLLRFDAEEEVYCNAHMDARRISQHCSVGDDATRHCWKRQWTSCACPGVPFTGC